MKSKPLRQLGAHRRSHDDVLMVEIGPYRSMNAQIAINFAMVTREEVDAAEKRIRDDD